MDSLQLRLPDLYFKTPFSELQAKVKLDLNAFDVHPGVFELQMKGAFGSAFGGIFGKK